MEKRYRALRIIGMLYKIIGGIILVITIVSAAGICVAGFLGGAALNEFSRDIGPGWSGVGFLSSALGGVLAALGMLIGGGLGGLTIFATGEAIYLLIDLEENTRAAALHVPAQAPQPPVILPSAQP